MSDLRDQAEAELKPPIEGFKDQELVEELETRGWILHHDDPQAERHVKVDVPKKGKIRFAVVGDTHLGSKYQQLSYWRDFYDQAAKWGAEFAIHGGDAVDGTHKMHRGMEFEQFRLGYEAQRSYAVDSWPLFAHQYSVGGNHDGSFHNDVGANILTDIAHERTDIQFLNAPAATLHLSGLNIYILHPDGGPSYARSYRLQKIVEQLPPDSKPHIMLAHHWHVASHLPGYRNVEAFAVPCFQAQTPYLRRKGLAPVIGGLLLEAEYSSRGLEDLTTVWKLYRDPMSKDFP